MNRSFDVIMKLVNFINDRLFLFAKAIRGYDNIEAELPIHHYVTALSTFENNVRYYLNETVDETTSEVTQEYCTNRKLTIKMSTYASMKKNGTTVHTMTEEMLQEINNHFASQMTGYDIGKIEVDDNLKAYKVVSYLYFEFNECPAEDVSGGATYPEPNFACRTHAKNETIHLTAKEKSYVQSPIVCGSYTGDGTTANHDIDLGFKPTAVIIFRAGGHILSNLTDSSTICSYLGFCCANGSIRGCNLLDNGFRVRTRSTNLVDGTNCDFNMADTKYIYIAFR